MRAARTRCHGWRQKTRAMTPLSLALRLVRAWRRGLVPRWRRRDWRARVARGASASRGRRRGHFGERGGTIYRRARRCRVPEGSGHAAGFAGAATSGLAVRNAFRPARLHAARRPDARPRHRRQQRGVRAARRRAAAAAAVPRSVAPGVRLADVARRKTSRARADARSTTTPGTALRSAFGDRDGATGHVHADRRRQPRAGPRLAHDRVADAAARHCAASRPQLHAGRRFRRHRAGRDPERRPVAAALRRRRARASDGSFKSTASRARSSA